MGAKMMSLGIKGKFGAGYLLMTVVLYLPFLSAWSSTDRVVEMYEAALKKAASHQAGGALCRKSRS
ncbi:MAG: hypothetical protein K8I29_05875 [Alphaproteobacteria bacterium]|uniref:Uncharacterized protein n=1 Tax=Candidatus Nitrobium versatile TaxID=2884831 RepID=A0A953M0W2_9BACT|nr:hypothetical protein [Candidatus Nitrobium versatile]